MSMEFSGSSPVDQQRQAEAVAGFGFFVDEGEVGLDGLFSDVEIGQVRIFMIRLFASPLSNRLQVLFSFPRQRQ